MREVAGLEKASGEEVPEEAGQAGEGEARRVHREEHRTHPQRRRRLRLQHALTARCLNFGRGCDQGCELLTVIGIGSSQSAQFQFLIVSTPPI